MDSKSLARRKKTSPQKKLGHNERKKNLKNAFAVTPAFRPVRKVLLVDDIYTTGNTLDAAAKAFKGKRRGEGLFFNYKYLDKGTDICYT